MQLQLHNVFRSSVVTMYSMHCLVDSTYVVPYSQASTMQVHAMVDDIMQTPAAERHLQCKSMLIAPPQNT